MHVHHPDARMHICTDLIHVCLCMHMSHVCVHVTCGRTWDMYAHRDTQALTGTHVHSCKPAVR